MARQILTDLDFNNVSKITNLPDGIDPQDAVTVAQLAALSAGLSWKDNARFASTGNVTIASPGASFDGGVPVASDRILLKDQTDPTENGIYIWNGSAIPMTRAPDAATFDDLESAVIGIDEGTANAGSTWRQTAVNGVIGTDDVIWGTFGTSAPAASESVAGIAEIATQTETNTGTDDTRFVTPAKLANWDKAPKRFTGTVGDGTNTQYTITHNLGTKALLISVYRNSGAYDQIECDVEFTTTNTITLRFAAIVTSAQFAYTILG